jgi:16S rRNA (cytosine1402-N4)-methyltransferase
MTFSHTPVLFQHVISLVAEHGPKRIIDATIGGGGHARGLLERLPEAQLLGIDRDDTAIAAASQNL